MSLVITDDQPLFKMADFSYTKRKIEEEEDISKNQESKSSIASRVAKYMNQTHLDDYAEICNAFFSFLFYCLYAIGTFCDKANPLHDECSEPAWMELAEIMIMVIICIDYLLFFFVSEARILYIFSEQSFVTYITVIPTALIRAKVVDQDEISMFFLRYWKVFRLFSISRLIKVFTRRDMPVIRVWFKLVYIIFLVILVFAAAMGELENGHSYRVI